MRWPDFSERADEPEWMDVRDYPLDDFAAVLNNLEVVNGFTRASPPTLTFLERLTAGWAPGTELRVADLGYGQGGMLRRIHRWAEARGLRPKLTGVDMNPRCRALAEAHTPTEMRIDWHLGDLFDWQPAEPPHAIVSALFTHHLQTPDIVRLRLGMPVRDCRLTMVTDNQLKYVRIEGFRPMIHDLAADPQELADRGDDPDMVARAAALATALDAWAFDTHPRITVPDAFFQADDETALIFDPNLAPGLLIGYRDEADLAAEIARRDAWLAAHKERSA